MAAPQPKNIINSVVYAETLEEEPERNKEEGLSRDVLGGSDEEEDGDIDSINEEYTV